MMAKVMLTYYVVPLQHLYRFISELTSSLFPASVMPWTADSMLVASRARKPWSDIPSDIRDAVQLLSHPEAHASCPPGTKAMILFLACNAILLNGERLFSCYLHSDTVTSTEWGVIATTLAEAAGGVP